MARINWMIIATWIALLVSLLIAFLFGWFQWERLTTAQRNKEQVNRNIAAQERNTRELRLQLKDVTKTIAAPNKDSEEPEFMTQLKSLMDRSGVRQVSIAPAVPTPLPGIGEQKPTPGATTGTTNNSATNTAKKEDPNKVVGYSLTNLPLDVRAVSTNLTVMGNFQSINIFVRQLYNCRFTGGGLRFGAPRAINVNSVQIGGADTQGQLRATMQVTRFVYKPEPPAKTQGTMPAASPGSAALPPASGQAKP